MGMIIIGMLPVGFAIAVCIFAVLKSLDAASLAAKRRTTPPPRQPGGADRKPDPRASFEWKGSYNRENHSSCCSGDPWDEPIGGRSRKNMSDDPWN